MTDKIEFYSETGDYGEFSNFARFAIQLKGKTWATVEHYFQAQKFAGTAYESQIQKATSPMKAAEMGRSRKIKMRRNWDNIKVNVMLEALRAKFSQHSELKELLLSTGDKILVEHTENDSYWGDGGDGSGKNRLGKLLMKVREELSTE
ncbi:NADAR family protein [Psychrobacter sp. I-STPA10]|uniref:NADAR family protein n=1 Tax=Psychrobacter sp. I-STPA10 TaxID=2585769 RepID=UPI001E40EDC9|nr:NADAR family protein [Psychrobacter sp. I-STPA10]